MAKKIKPRADVAEITSGFEELPIINSRPIDVFVAPSRVPTSASVNALINSLIVKFNEKAPGNNPDNVSFDSFFEFLV